MDRSARDPLYRNAIATKGSAEAVARVANLSLEGPMEPRGGTSTMRSWRRAIRLPLLNHFQRAPSRRHAATLGFVSVHDIASSPNRQIAFSPPTPAP